MFPSAENHCYLPIHNILTGHFKTFCCVNTQEAIIYLHNITEHNLRSNHKILEKVAFGCFSPRDTGKINTVPFTETEGNAFYQVMLFTPVP